MPEPPRRRSLVLLVSPLVGLTIVALSANALAPVLLVRHPLLLIMMSSRNRYLIGTAGSLDVAPFVLIAVARRFIEDPLWFILGRSYGTAAVRWAEQRAGGGVLVRALERGFLRARYPMMFFFPGSLVCVLGGATGMGVRVFVLLDLVGTLTVVALLRAFGFALSEPVNEALQFLNRHLIVTTVASTVLVVTWMILQRRRGHPEVVSLEEIVEELEGSAAATDAGDEQQQRRSDEGYEH